MRSDCGRPCAIIVARAAAHHRTNGRAVGRAARYSAAEGTLQLEASGQQWVRLGMALHVDANVRAPGFLSLIHIYGVFGCMSLLACHDVCPKNLPLATQIAFMRRKMVAIGWK